MRRRIKNPAELLVMGANPAELLVMGANPGAKKKRARRNPGGLESASEAYEEFHGESAKHVDTFHEPDPRTVTLAKLGDLVELRVKRAAGWKEGEFDFTGMGIAVARNTPGNQIYFIGGDQRVSRGQLTTLGVDNSKDIIDLGECFYIAYRARKMQVNGIASDYEHFFGEENGIRPRLQYDRRGAEPRLNLAGGAYYIDGRGIGN